MRGVLSLAITLTGCLCLAATASAGDGVGAGALVVEPPTLRSLGFEWRIEGDDNRNASVALTYRLSGSEQWREGLPPLRLHGERTVFWGSLDYTAPNMFAGSVFYLEPGATYDVRLVLQDPDGVSGEATRIVTVTTRSEPMPATGGNTYHVYPPGYEGQQQQPAFQGLLAAYYTAALGGDWSRASPPRVKAGDTILVHGGVYKDFNRHNYSHEIQSGFTTCCGTPFDGTYFLTADGTPDKPIAIKAAGDGEVIFDGDGNNVLFNVVGGDYHYFEGITFRNTVTAIEAGQKGIAGTRGLTVKRSRFFDVGIAVHTDWSGSSNFYIADNVMIGRQNPDELFGWYNVAPWNQLPDFETRRLIHSYYAVAVYGSGHVVAYNRISGFHDAVDHATYGMPDDYPNTRRDRMPVSIDFHNNDVSNVDDNCFEADGSMHNIRVFDNRCFNAGVGAMSPQPVFGGPAYFIRNVVYHSPFGPVKIHGDPAGAIYYHNTYIGEVAQLTPASNLHFRNNLIFGQGRRPAVFAVQTYTNYSSSDYNGFRPNPESDTAFEWHAPPKDIPARYDQPPVAQRFKSFAAYRRATGQDQHSVLLDYDIFVNARMPDFNDPTRLYKPDEVDLQLKAGAGAIDAGVALPNINDGFNGSAPDLGAYEYGQPMPHYGPRP
ncbi:MAG: hypothetical protein H6978_11880 [Gammaproteobacteria bacterium]|nr:hypothetical protein [Gammaproteobacteria bacterium]